MKFISFPKKKKRMEYSPSVFFLEQSSTTLSRDSRLVVLECCLVWYSQLLATLWATCSQYLTAIGSSHSLTETVLVDSLTTRRLVSSFHCHSCICFLLFLFRLTLLLRGAKVQRFFVIANNSAKIFCFLHLILQFSPQKGWVRHVLPCHRLRLVRRWMVISPQVYPRWRARHCPWCGRA